MTDTLDWDPFIELVAAIFDIAFRVTFDAGAELIWSFIPGFGGMDVDQMPFLIMLIALGGLLVAKKRGELLGMS